MLPITPPRNDRGTPEPLYGLVGIEPTSGATLRPTQPLERCTDSNGFCHQAVTESNRIRTSSPLCEFPTDLEAQWASCTSPGGEGGYRRSGMAGNQPVMSRGRMAPKGGFEPPTHELTVRRSAIELPRNARWRRMASKPAPSGA